jgi:ABC-type polysaccharide/polyol phosphate transport system ATPase subunit
LVTNSIGLNINAHYALRQRRANAAFANHGQYQFANRLRLPIVLPTLETGTAARLDFAISTSIEPDILLIDEGIGA